MLADGSGGGGGVGGTASRSGNCGTSGSNSGGVMFLATAVSSLISATFVVCACGEGGSGGGGKLFVMRIVMSNTIWRPLKGLQ